MTATQLEIVMLDNGDVALRRSGEAEDLVRIAFGQDVKEMLGEYYTEIARQMFDAGIEAVADVNAILEDEAPEERRVLH